MESITGPADRRGCKDGGVRLRQRFRAWVAADPQGVTDWVRTIAEVGGGEAAFCRLEVGPLLA